MRPTEILHKIVSKMAYDYTPSEELEDMSVDALVTLSTYMSTRTMAENITEFRYADRYLDDFAKKKDLEAHAELILYNEKQIKNILEQWDTEQKEAEELSKLIKRN